MAKFKPENIFTGPVSVLSKALRLKILLDRKRGQFGKVDTSGGPDAYQYENSEAFPNVGGAGFGKSHRRDIGRNNDAELNDKLGYLFETAGAKKQIIHQKDYIALIDANPNPDSEDARKYTTLVLPFVPKQLDYNPESNFVGIATMGRNNPHYHYTGSEDTLEFTIDWFSRLLNRQDVIFNCRWLESMSKADGYKAGPHKIQLVWGADNILFGDSKWLVMSAKYTLSNFVDSYRDPTTGVITKVGMLPQQALQTVVLKRVTTTNRSMAEIVGIKSLKPLSVRYSNKKE